MPAAARAASATSREQVVTAGIHAAARALSHHKQQLSGGQFNKVTDRNGSNGDCHDDELDAA